MDETEKLAPNGNPPFATYTDTVGAVHEVGTILPHPDFRGFATAVRRSDGKLITLETHRLKFLSPVK